MTRLFNSLSAYIALMIFVGAMLTIIYACDYAALWLWARLT